MKRLMVALSLMLTICFSFSMIHAEETTGGFTMDSNSGQKME